MPGDVWVVAGLGNPGPAYAATRHNVGYLVVDELLARAGSSLRPDRSGRALAAEGRLGDPGGPRAVLVRSRGYMNVSGGPVAAVLAYYKVQHDRLIVVHDELDIPFGELRVKLGGGDNGHNGLRSIRDALGDGEYYRVRVGIGRPPGRQDAADYVLQPWDRTEQRDLDLNVRRAADSVESLAVAGLEQTQNLYNR
ncbi:MAG: aminoacyl-tRNA hydrolase [Nocardioidaceae bacterium]